MNYNNANGLYTAFNLLGVGTAYFMLSLSVWLAPVDLSTKGYWGMGVFLLTLSLVNFIKYRMDDRASQDRLAIIETAKNDKLIEEYAQEN